MSILPLRLLRIAGTRCSSAEYMVDKRGSTFLLPVHDPAAQSQPREGPSCWDMVFRMYRMWATSS